LPPQEKHPQDLIIRKEAAMIPMLTELARFARYLFSPETEIAAVQYDSAAAGAVKAGLWMALAVAAGIVLARAMA
jgi:hypothetical protein